ncbi:MAG TPA: glycosyltransferase, partial [Gemmatimonadaceae bacterium]|nr:glycosyltransferase [Gemmatimonadaceae bacterium]
MKKRKIIHAHNYYLQPGGEDTAFVSEVKLLREHGHDVIEYVEDNHTIETRSPASVAAQTLWSWNTTRKLSLLLEREKPDIVHFHNTFPLISPSAYYACQTARVPVIQSLDNPRLMCPSANFFRDGGLCQDCLGRTPPWPGVVHSCYRGSALQTAVVASMLTLHRAMRTWNSRVDFYLVATEFYRQKFIEGGLAPEKIVVKPHFTRSDSGASVAEERGNYAIFVGRLDPEKGVR